MNTASDTVPAGLPTTLSAGPALAGHGGLRAALAFALLAVAGFGLAYPLLGVGLAQALFPAQAGGSLVEHQGRVVGSALVAQPFADPRYFAPRPSAAEHQPMDAGGSNEARTNPELRERLAKARAAVAARDGVPPEQVPADLLTQSSGGFDPHISPVGAALQVARVAAARGLPPQAVQAVVAQHTESPTWGLLGQPRVNVLALNLALDALPAHAAAVSSPEPAPR